MAQGEFYRSMSFHRIVVSNAEREKELRTDKRFRDRFQPQHHLQSSALEDLPIDMIKQFPVSDSLHLIDLGVMKRSELEKETNFIHDKSKLFEIFQIFLGVCLDGWEN